MLKILNFKTAIKKTDMLCKSMRCTCNDETAHIGIAALHCLVVPIRVGIATTVIPALPKLTDCPLHYPSG